MSELEQQSMALYALLASLWRSPLQQEGLQWLQNMPVEEGPLREELNLLKHAAANHDEVALAQEYQALFIGLGRGEIVPFASWYLTGSLMELPLAVLRSDLQRLGFERQAGVAEPEDHLAALCEVMLILIQEQHPQRQQFYERHLAPWVVPCCRDQQQAKEGSFYRAVGALGARFFQLENEWRLPFGIPVVSHA